MESEAKPEEKTNTNELDLDSILDDALEDFTRPVPPKKSDESPKVNNATPLNTNVWTDEFIASATQNFESTMKTMLNQQSDTTAEETGDEMLGSVDLGAMSAEFAKFAEAAAKAATESSTDGDFTKCLADTMQQMAKNQEEAQVVPTPEDLAKMFENFDLGEMGEGGNDLGGLFPMMQTMLENILSKEILYPPLKEITTKYPDWLADNRSTLSEGDYERYNKQFDIMKQVVHEFEKEESDEAVKKQTSESILTLMQKLQELGQPPQELMGDATPFPGLHDKGTPQMPDLSSLLAGTGFPSLGLADTGAGAGPGLQAPNGPSLPGVTNDQCSVM